ncbi:hypothetical protein [Saccharopolyspora pogona]|nr:hypothetical protein [Saccharopolyspora pogona]
MGCEHEADFYSTRVEPAAGAEDQFPQLRALLTAAATTLEIRAP